MRWLLRAIRPGEVALTTLIGGVLSGLLTGRDAPVPSLTAGAMSPAPVVAMLALVPLIAVLRSLDSPPATLVALSTRPIGLYRATTTVALGLITCAGAFAVAGPSASLEVVRNLSGLFGLAIIGWTTLGRGAALALPIVYILASYLFGRTGPSTVAWWAWIIRDPHDATAATLAATLAVLGLSVLTTLPRSDIRRAAD
jgi:hypothetical protein